jgi:hypothetical protein
MPLPSLSIPKCQLYHTNYKISVVGGIYLIERSNNPKEREQGYKTEIMIFTTLLQSSLQSQSYLPFSIPSTLLGSASVFASSQEPESPLRYNEDVGNPVFIFFYVVGLYLYANKLPYNNFSNIRESNLAFQKQGIG